MKHIGGRGDLRLARRLLVRELIWMKPPKRWGNQAVRQRLSAYVLLPGRPTPETLPCRSRPLKSKMPQTSFPQQFLKLICPKEINLAGRKRFWKPTFLESRLNHSKTRRWAWRIRGWRIPAHAIVSRKAAVAVRRIPTTAIVGRRTSATVRTSAIRLITTLRQKSCV